VSDIALILLFSLIGLKCINKVYKISLEIDFRKSQNNTKGLLKNGGDEDL
jgi:hypothetical protein